MNYSSITISGDRSGAGKTTFTCALLNILKKRGYSVCSFKCGPDYIDPMYHRSVMGIPSGNIDSYFTSEDVMRRIVSDKMKKCGASFSVIEGAMGYYDGLGGVSTEGSCYDISVKLSSPVILIVNASAVSVSLAASIKGMLEFRSDNKISGVILNCVSHNFYPRLKDVVEKECGVKVLGYIPPGMSGIPSRHLGLVAPEEISDFERWLANVSKQVESTVDIDGIISLAGDCELLEEENCEAAWRPKSTADGKIRCTIAVARDEAFSFYYEENINLLRRLGAVIKYFSPINDEKIPEDADGLILGGGYPENCAKELAGNTSMKADILEKIRSGIPFLAECGGFLYLQKSLADTDGNVFEMVGFFDDGGENTGGLMRFGYLEAEMKEDCIFGAKGTVLRGHEFHHWDVSDPGNDVIARKPFGMDYGCMKCSDSYAAGFPHFYYESNPKALKNFIDKCEEYGKKYDRQA